MEGEGFEPSKAKPSDLQSDPFDRSGTPPNEKPSIMNTIYSQVNIDLKYAYVCLWPKPQIRQSDTRITHIHIMLRLS